MAKLINILLRKTDPDYPWGFTLGALPPALHSIQITWVDKGSLASEHLEPGDRVLEIEGIDTTMLSNAEVEAMLTNPSNKLELLIMKKNKPIQKSTEETREISVNKVVKTKDTISTTSEERGETKILNEDFLEESKIITREGTLHKQIMETTECTEKNLKTDTSFWTCPPSDLIKQEGKNKGKEQNVACKNTSGNSYLSESAIFKSLNNHRDELRKIDPREEKRRFWESCRKGDSIRRFKWGDSVKPNRGPSPAYKSDGSMESLYSKSESQTHPVPKMERSKSCEPMDSLPSSNPFSSSFPRESSTRAELSSTNPFHKEFGSQHQAYCDSSPETKSWKSIESESKTMESNGKISTSAYIEDSLKRDFLRGNLTENLVSSTVNEKFTEKEKCVENTHESCNSFSSESYNLNNEDTAVSNQHEYVSSTTHEQLLKQEKDTSTNTANKTVRFNDTNKGPSEIQNDTSPSQPMRFTKAIGKEEFETKCKFFEKATSAPVLCANKNAKDLVEERLKEGSAPTSPSMSPSAPRKTISSTSDVHLFSDVHADESHLHLLKKPSDFINQQFKCNVSLPDRLNERTMVKEQPLVIPTIKVSEYSERDVSDEISKKPTTQYQSSINPESPQREKNSGLAHPQPVYANISGCIAKCKSSGVEQSANVTYQGTSERSSVFGGGSVNMNSTGTRNSTGNKININDISTQNHVVSNSNVVSGTSSSSEVSWGTNHTSCGTRPSVSRTDGQPPQMQHESMLSGVQWFTGGVFPGRALHDQVRSQRGGSLERDFYEKRTFKESSFEKVIRCSNSPYENVESASSREYQEESGPSKNAMNRSKTPAGFYDNSYIDELAKEMRAKSPLDISSKSFEDIRNRLGSLLGATPTNIRCERSKLLISRGGIDHVEEAFQKLAMQEGIVENSTADQVPQP